MVSIGRFLFLFISLCLGALSLALYYISFPSRSAVGANIRVTGCAKSCGPNAEVQIVKKDTAKNFKFIHTGLIGSELINAQEESLSSGRSLSENAAFKCFAIKTTLKCSFFRIINVDATYDGISCGKMQFRISIPSPTSERVSVVSLIAGSVRT